MLSTQSGFASIQEKGFTLIELIVVILILAILSAIALPKFTSLQRDARIAKLNAAKGSVASSSALIHATVLTRSNIADNNSCAGGDRANNKSGETGNVCTEDGLVNLTYAYPDVTKYSDAGILSAAGLTTIFNPTQEELEAEGYIYIYKDNVAIFQINGATNSGECQFTYTEATENTAPVISAVTTSGC